MNHDSAIQILHDTLRRKHYSLSTEQCYTDWLRRFMRYVLKQPVMGHKATYGLTGWRWTRRKRRCSSTSNRCTCPAGAMTANEKLSHTAPTTT